MNQCPLCCSEDYEVVDHNKPMKLNPAFVGEEGMLAVGPSYWTAVDVRRCLECGEKYAVSYDPELAVRKAYLR